MVKISIIIPIYNSELYIEECIKSIITQSFTNIEIICINDASTDNSLKILKNLSEIDSRIKIYSLEKHSKQGYARNFALDNAIGEYIMFVDSDDILAPNALTDFYNAIINNECDIVISHIKNFNDTNCPNEKLCENLDNYNLRTKHKEGINFVKNITEYRVGPVAKLYKNNLIKKYNIRFSENIFHEDNIFHWAYFSIIEKCYFLETPFYLRRVHSQSTLSHSDGNIKLNAYLQFLPEIKAFLVKNKIYKKHKDEFETYFYNSKNRLIVNATGKKEIKFIKKKFRKLENNLFFTGMERIFSIKALNNYRTKVIITIFGMKIKFNVQKKGGGGFLNK